VVFESGRDLAAAAALQLGGASGQGGDARVERWGHTDEARVVSVSDQTVLAMELDFSPIRLSFRDMQSE
jgi:hypothetical protein